MATTPLLTEKEEQDILDEYYDNTTNFDNLSDAKKDELNDTKTITEITDIITKIEKKPDKDKSSLDSLYLNLIPKVVELHNVKLELVNDADNQVLNARKDKLADAVEALHIDFVKEKKQLAQAQAVEEERDEVDEAAAEAEEAEEAEEEEVSGDAQTVAEADAAPVGRGGGRYKSRRRRKKHNSRKTHKKKNRKTRKTHKKKNRKTRKTHKKKNRKNYKTRKM